MVRWDSSIVVISGGSYSGKTTTIKELRRRGYNVISETALSLIAKLNKKLGVSKQKKWRLKNKEKFQIMLLKEQIKKEGKIKPIKENIIFLDRGVYDIISYYAVDNLKIPKEALKAIKGHKYDLVFVLDTLSDFKQRIKTGRTSNKNKSIKINNLIKKTYKINKIKVISVREMSVKKRVDFIIKNTKSGIPKLLLQ